MQSATQGVQKRKSAFIYGAHICVAGTILDAGDSEISPLLHLHEAYILVGRDG